MTAPSPARRLARMATVVSLVMSGLYMFVYLYRWEWNRALIAGVFFLGAEIALATSMILERLPRASQTAAAHPRPVPARPHSDPESPFAWLTPLMRGDRFGVFVPVLLGAGVVLSTLAFAVERLAAITTNRGGGTRIAGSRALPSLTLPPGGYLHRRPPAPARMATGRRMRTARIGAVGVLAVAAGTAGLDALADATQARPDPRQSGTTTLVVQGERRDGPDATAALRLWERCRTLLPSRLAVTTTTDGVAHVTAELGTVLGPLAERKLRGCLEDASLPGIRGRVMSLERHPSASISEGYS